jgi:hypothetical protein
MKPGIEHFELFKTVQGGVWFGGAYYKPISPSNGGAYYELKVVFGYNGL